MRKSGPASPPRTARNQGRSPNDCPPKADWSERILFTHVGRWPKGTKPEEYKYRDCSVRSPRWHLVGVDKKGAKAWQLFDIQADTGEKTDVADKHPDVVKDLIEGESDAIDYIAANKADAQKVVNDGIAKITGKPLKDSVIQASFTDLQFTLDPIASSLQKSANDAKDVGLLKSTDVTNIYDLTLLNEFLQSKGKPTVKGLT